jgi:hypothetical protein
MRSLRICIVLGCLVLTPAGGWADEPRAVLDRAIEAHGGEARLAKTKVGRLKAKVEEAGPGTGSRQATWEEVFDLPGRYRQTMEEVGRGEASLLEYVVVGRKGWQRQGQGAPQDFPVVEAPAEEHWNAFLLQLLRLRGKDVKLTALGEERRDGRALTGIRAVSPTGTLDLYFDTATGLLARARLPLPNFLPGREAASEATYEDYRDVGGVRYPMHVKVTAGAGQYRDIVLTSLEFLDKIDDSAFAKPFVPPPPEAGAAPDTRPEDGATAPDAERLPRWDVRLVVATLTAGGVVGAVWLFVRASRRRKGERGEPGGKAANPERT